MNLKVLVKREILIAFTTIAFVIVGLFGLSYAFVMDVEEGQTNVISFGDIDFALCVDSSDLSCGTTASNLGNVVGTQLDGGGNSVPTLLYPVSDAVGLATTPYKFILTNTGDYDLFVKVKLEPDTTFVIGSEHSNYSNYTQTDFSSIKIAFNEVGSSPVISTYDTIESNGFFVNDYAKITAGSSKIFELRSWVSSTAANNAVGTYFVSQISVIGHYFPNDVIVNDRDLFHRIISDNTLQTNSINFNQISSASNGEGLYEYSENGTPIYYFRGTHSLKNNVIFAGYCWKIIRTTALGNVRMIYNGVPNASNQCLTTTGASTSLAQTSAFNASSSVYQYNAGVGYTYGTPNSTTFEAEHYGNTSSTIKTVVDAWYNGTGAYTSLTNKLVDYSSYLAPDGFCADRSFASSNTGTGYGSSDTYYGAFDRLFSATTKTPNLSCGVNDLANINVGLITADELFIAGGTYNTSNTNFYLYSNTSYWTTSPATYNLAKVWYITSSGQILYIGTTDSSIHVRPVIALNSAAVVSGAGTGIKPYIVPTN